MESCIKQYYKSNSSKNIISCSIFPMKTSYRNFNKYLEGLDLIINKFKKHFNNTFKLRIYFDSKLASTFEQDKYLNNDFLQLAQYKCPKFIRDDFHIGIFGMFVRFIPLFISKKEQLNTVVI